MMTLKTKMRRNTMKRLETDGSLQQQEITVTVIMIPALMQTHSCPKGETLDRQWVGRLI